MATCRDLVHRLPLSYLLQRRAALALAVCLGAWMAPAALSAQPQVAFFYFDDNGVLQPGLPPQVLIGEPFDFVVKVSPGATTGYGPFVELYLDFQGADCNAPAPSTVPQLPCDGAAFVSAAAQFTVTKLPITACSTTGGLPFVFPVSGSGCVSPPVCPGTASSPAPTCFFGEPPPGPPSCLLENTAGYQKVVLPLPFGSFVPSQPPVLVPVTAFVSALANPGSPLTIKARGGFQYSTALGGPPIVDTTCHPMVSKSTTPEVIVLHKKYLGPEDETATGPNFPVTYQISVDVASGATVNNLTVTDCLSTSLVYLSSSLPPASTTPCVTWNLGTLVGGTTDPDQSFTVTAYVPLDDSASGQPVLGASCKTPIDNPVTGSGQWTPLDPREPGPETVTAQADHKITAKCIALQKSVKDTNTAGPIPGDTLQYRLDFQISDFDTFDQIVIEDYLADGLVLTGTPTLSVSDQFGAVASTPISPHSFFPHSFTCGDGTQLSKPTQLEFQVSTALAPFTAVPRYVNGILTGGRQAGSTTGPGAIGTLLFSAKISDLYSHLGGGTNVKKDDPLPNCATIGGTLLKDTIPPIVPTMPVGAGDDDSLAKVTIVTGILHKSIYAVNTFLVPPATTPLVSPGDDVTFRVKLPIPSSDAASLSFQDFLPLPVFSVSGFSTGTVPCSPAPLIPLLNSARALDPLCSDPLLGGAGDPNLTVDVPPGSNNLAFTYPATLNQPNNPAQDADLFFTLQASAAPYVDDLNLTNHVLESEQNSFGVQFDQTEVAPMLLGEPELRIRKGVVVAADPLVVFTPAPPSPVGVVFHPPGSFASPPFTGIINSANVGTALNSDASSVNGCDHLRFVIAIENIGHSAKGAFNVRLRDQLPACLQSPTILRVVRGDGTPLSCFPFSTCSVFGPFGLFGGGIRVIDPSSTMGALGPYNALTGKNIAIITFDATVPCSIAPTGCCTNTARLLAYAGVPGGPNHVLANFSTPFPDTTNPFVDGAQVCVQPQLTKSIPATSEPVTGTPRPLAIGEVVRYRLQAALPVGVATGLTFTDTLTGLNWMPFTCVSSHSSGVTIPSGFPTFTPSSTFSPTLTVNFSTVTTSGSGGGALAVECNALVLNSPPGALPANHLLDARPNHFTATISPSTGPPVTFTSNVVPAVIVEPAGGLVKQEVTPFPGAPPNAAFYRLSYTNTGTADAYDVRIQDPLPASLPLLPGSVSVNSANPCTLHPAPLASNTIVVTCPSISHGSGVSILFSVVGVPLCQTVTNQATLTYSSLPGLHGTFPNPTGSFPPGLPGAPRGKRVYSFSAILATLRCPDLALTKTQFGPFNGFDCGQNGSYQLGVTNLGNASSVPPETITDTLPAGLSFVSGVGAGWSCSASGATVTCTNPNPIPPGASSGLLLTAAVTCPPAVPGSLTNCATVSTSPEINLSNNQSCAVTTIFPAPGCVKAIAAGADFSLAIRNDHTALAWGDNGFGNVGDGTTTGRTTPTGVKGLAGVVAMDGGSRQTLALLQDGSVWAWGDNSLGSLGIGAPTHSLVPARVLGVGGVGFLGNVQAIAAGGFHSLALLGNGTVVAWGYNTDGQLGNGTTTTSNVPVPVPLLTGVVAIAAGYQHSLALLSNGTVVAWGDNFYGQLGNGGTANSSMPVMVKDASGSGILTGVQAIAAGNFHSLALLNDQTVRSWGLNQEGQLGNGSFASSSLPVQVLGVGGSGVLSGVTALAGGDEHSLALTATSPNGAVLAWGFNGDGELGDGSNTTSNVPVTTAGLTGSTIVAIAAGDVHSLALLADGTVRAWGFNGSGQLGNGSTTGSNLPVTVVVPCPPCTAAPAGLAAWWPFDEAHGPVAADLVDPADNGAYVGAPTPVLGEVGNALCFDGLHDYVDVPTLTDVDLGTGDLSIDLWVRTTAGAGVQTILDKRQTSPALIGYSLFLFKGLLGFQMADRPGSTTCANSPSASCTNWFAATGNVADGLWHLVAVTVSRGVVGGGTFYVDGVPVGSFDPTLRSLSLNNSADLWIGANHDDSTHFPGCLDEVEIYKRALDPNEILAIYQAGSGGKCKAAFPNLVMHKTIISAFLGFNCNSNNFYSLGVSNVGTAPSVPPETIVDNLPAGVTFVSFMSSPGGGWSCVPSNSNTTVTCTSPTAIAPGGSSGATLTVMVACTPGETSVTNCATVSTTLPPSQNQACIMTPVR